MRCVTKTTELVGSNCEIGRKLEKIVVGVPQLRVLYMAVYPGSGEEKAKEVTALLERWCPGFNKGLPRLVEVLQMPASQLAFCATTSLRPNCSQVAVLPSMTESGRPLLARNYEFSPMFEDFILVGTSVLGKHRHMGTSVFLFGREDEFNERELTATTSSYDMSVEAEQGMRRTKVNGLQYWAVIQTLLENYRDVEEVFAYMKEMPVIFNLNLMLVDKGGRIMLVEILSDRMAMKRIPGNGGEQYSCATNHQVIPELTTCEPVATRHSLQWYRWIREEMDHSDKVGREQLKEMLLSMCPEGIYCHFYEAFFGTTRSMIISPTAGTIESCRGGEAANGWKVYGIEEPFQTSVAEIEVHNVPFQREFKEFLPTE